MARTAVLGFPRIDVLPVDDHAFDDRVLVAAAPVGLIAPRNARPADGSDAPGSPAVAVGEPVGA